MKLFSTFQKSGQRRSTPTGYEYQTMEPRCLMSCNPGMVQEDLATPSVSVPQTNVSTQEPRIGRIVNGTVTSQYESVGMIGDRTGFFCSGTLIGSRYVLTAGHCAEGLGNTDGRFQLGSQIYSTSRVVVHPNYNPNLIGSDNANDIALYVLDRDVVGISPTPIYRSAPTVGQLLTLVGFGAGGTGNSGHNGDFGIKRVGTTPIDQVTSKLIRWSFDNNSESNTAPGDSGGPGFVTVNGKLYVAGVTSGGDQANAGIGDNSYDTRVDAFASWIDSITGSVNAAPTVSIIASDPVAGETNPGQALNTANFTISRTGSLASPLTVLLTTSGTATKGVDYVALPTSVTIPAGSASTTIAMTPKDDNLVEGTESVIVSLAPGAGYQVGSANQSVALSILDNEVATWNNNFANRFSLTGSNATGTGTNIGATRETGEPNVLNLSGGKSVWWTWKAPASGQVVMSTAGSNFDTTLGVYTGSSVNGLTLVRANDDQNLSAGIYTSRVSFNAVAGRQYQILVDGYNGDAGTVKINVNQQANQANRIARRLADQSGSFHRSHDSGHSSSLSSNVSDSGRHRVSRTALAEISSPTANRQPVTTTLATNGSARDHSRGNNFHNSERTNSNIRNSGGRNVADEHLRDSAFANLLLNELADRV